MYSLLTCFPGIFCNYFQLFQPTPQLYISPGGIGRSYGNIYTSTPTASFSFQLIQSNILCRGGGGFCLYLNTFYSEVRSVDDLSLLPLERMDFRYDPFLRIQGTYPLTPQGIRYRGPTPSLPQVLDTGDLLPHSPRYQIQGTYSLTPSYLIYRGPIPSLPQILDIQGVYPLTPPAQVVDKQGTLPPYRFKQICPLCDRLK